MTRRPPPHVAVAGAGIAGLTAALALARSGCRVDVFEQAPVLQEVGAGIQLSPNAMRLLQRLDVAGEIEAAAVEPRAIEIGDGGNGRLLARIPLGEVATRRYGSPYRVVHRADLQMALLRLVRRHPAIALHLDTPLLQAVAHANGVTLQLRDRCSSADLLVAADGIRSRIRTAHFGHAAAAPLGRTAWRTSLPVDAARAAAARMDVTCLWLGSGAHLVHYPLQAGATLNMVAISSGGRQSPGPPSSAFGRPLQALLAAAPSWMEWPLQAIDESLGWVRGRVVLIGDAAHGMPPTAAQGGAQAIEDAWVLASCIAKTPTGLDAALAAYQALRRPRIERVARESRRNMLIYNLQGFAGFLRNRAIASVPADLHLRRLDWLFGWRPD